MRVWPRLYRRQGYIAVFFLTLLFLLNSCGKKAGESPVVPPPTSPLSRPVIGYGVVNVSYTHVVEKPGEGSQSTGYLRRGSLVCILERRILKGGDHAEFWVLAEELSPPGQYRGWLKESVVDIYENKFQARTAIESMTQ
jgi:hypothetical protein